MVYDITTKLILYLCCRYSTTTVDFKKGLIEDLSASGIAPSSIDIVCFESRTNVR